MKLECLGRQGGKTTRAIKEAAETKSYILTLTRADAHRIARQAEEMGLHIRFPVTVDELKHSKMSTGFVNDLVIDDLDRILGALFPHHKIHMATITVEQKLESEPESKNNKGDTK